MLFKTKTIFMKLEVLLASHKRGALSSIHYIFTSAREQSRASTSAMSAGKSLSIARRATSMRVLLLAGGVRDNFLVNTYARVQRERFPAFFVRLKTRFFF